MKKEILQDPDERLARIALPVSHDDALVGRLVQDLIDTMGPTDLGIAAPQIGCGVRVVVAKIPLLTAMVNPEWFPAGAKRPGMEGCLSVLNGRVRSRIFRHIAIDARWIGTDGTVNQQRLTGRDAVVFQHEVDHLDGITINRQP